MANSRAANVLRVDTAATFSECLRIKSIKVVNANAAAQTSTIKKTDSSGVVLYSSAVGATSEKHEEAAINAMTGVHVTPGTDCVVYIYLK